MKKIIIVAAAENNVIGKDGMIPWHSKEDMKHFKTTTMGFPIIMGRKTFDSLGKPLKGRLNIVISRNSDYKNEFEDVLTFNQLDEAFIRCEADNYEKVFIIGGGEIYKEALKIADEIIITKMNLQVEGDTYFPQINPENWKLISEERFDEFDIQCYARI
ncbi:dihydrofolate reductase [Bacteroidota bacterium]